MSVSKDAANEGSRNRYLTRTKMIYDFDNYRAALEWQLTDDHSATKEANGKLFIKDLIDDIIPKIPYGDKLRDTSLGGNDALNCFYSFNEDDDIIPPYNQILKKYDRGLGRVYDDVFQQQQKLVHLSFGIADFGNIKSFYERLIDVDLSALMNRGDTTAFAHEIGNLVAKSALFVFALPIVAAKWACDWVTKPGATSPSKYYDFKQQMPTYFELVNTILIHLSINMNLAPPAGFDEDIGTGKGISPTFKATAFDALTILNRKHILDHSDSELSRMNTMSWWDTLVKLGPEAFDNFLSGVKEGLNESLLYVGFRLERGSDATESFSNATKSSDLEGKINSGLKSQRDRMFNINGIQEMGGLGNAVKLINNAFSGLLEGTAGAFGIDGTTELMKGSGIIDIPDVWEDSDYSTTQSFSLKLRCPSPDPVSIFYSLYVPLAYLLAGVLPRSVGPNAYTSPFLVRLYAKGLYAIPMGIIDNLTVSRGGSEFGWSVAGFPTQIDINFTVKDLSKVLHVPIGRFGGKESSLFRQLLGQNSSFQEYMATLGGLGVMERTLMLKIVKRRARMLLRHTFSTKLNPLHWGFALANTKGGRVIAAFNPWSGLPK